MGSEPVKETNGKKETITVAMLIYTSVKSTFLRGFISSLPIPSKQHYGNFFSDQAFTVCRQISVTCRAQNNFWTVAGHNKQPKQIVAQPSHVFLLVKI